MSPPAPPVALTVAGSDCSAGAGIQADLKTFSAHGVYGLTALTCVVAEVPGQVASIQPIDPANVRRQIELCLHSFPVAAMKTGLLHSCAAIEAVASFGNRLPPLVIDPVMIASSGERLMEPEAVMTCCEELFPLAVLVTPNLDEAQALLNCEPIEDAITMRKAGAELCARFRTPFLVKGGHLGSDEAVDLLCLPNGTAYEFRAPFAHGFSTHGTGCTYSAAITARLAFGLELPEAISRAKRYITAAIEQSFRWSPAGHIVDALNHWQRL